MKRPLTIPDEPQPRNITRADLVMTEGFGLEVDGRMKTIFPTLAAAQKSALDPSKNEATAPFAEAMLSRRSSQLCCSLEFVYGALA